MRRADSHHVNDNAARPTDAPNAPRLGWALAALALWLLAGAGTRALLLPDEGRYVGVAYWMLHGDALVPRLNGLPFFHKPPLMYWLDAAALRVFGLHEIAARMAPVVGALVMAAAIAWDLRRVFGARQALVVLAMLATAPLFCFGGQYANHDMLVAGLVTAAIVAGVRAAEPGAPLRWVALSWAAAALAVLAKGLIGVVLPALVLAPWLAARRDWRALARLLHPLGWLAFALVAAPWFLAMQARYPAFADYFFMEQHVRRYAQGGFNNVRPFWFFWVVLPLLTLPWSLALLLPARWRALRESAALDRHGRIALYAWWAAAVLLFFSLPQSKLVGYALPALAPWGALLGLAMPAAAAGTQTATQTATPGRGWRWTLVLGALICVAIAIGVARRHPGSHEDVGLALGARVQPGDRVVYVGEPYFDLAFYARLAQPAIVLGDWNSPGYAANDDWRKELADAGRFDRAAAARLLWPVERAGELVCGVPRVWWVAPPDARPPAAAGAAERVMPGQLATLWQSAGRGAAPCP